MPALRLPRELLAALIDRARAHPDAEICGLLSARGGRFVRHYPVRNVAPDPHGRFDMDPAQLIAAFRDMREARESLLAIYHSHPASPPLPSAADLTEHAYPDAACLILAPRGAVAARAFRIRGGACEELDLEEEGG